MVGTIVLFVLWCVAGWIFNRASNRQAAAIAKLKSESEKQIEATQTFVEAIAALDRKMLEGQAANTDLVARVEFAEKRLTAKDSTKKIVPKAHKRTFRQFAEAASQATEEME